MVRSVTVVWLTMAANSQSCVHCTCVWLFAVGCINVKQPSGAVPRVVLLIVYQTSCWLLAVTRLFPSAYQHDTSCILYSHVYWCRLSLLILSNAVCNRRPSWTSRFSFFLCIFSWLSMPVLSIACKDSAPEWPVVCQLRHILLAYLQKVCRNATYVHEEFSERICKCLPCCPISVWGETAHFVFNCDHCSVTIVVTTTRRFSAYVQYSQSVVNGVVEQSAYIRKVHVKWVRGSCCARRHFYKVLIKLPAVQSSLVFIAKHNWSKIGSVW